MLIRWTGFCVWALVAAMTVSWTLRIFADVRPVPAGAQAPQVVAANGPMTRLFGAVAVASAASAAVPPESSRFQLLGVIAPGFAILSIDGQLPRTWRVGSVISDSTALLAVTRRAADFGPPGGTAAFSLQLPEPGSDAATAAAAGPGAPRVATPPPMVTVAPPQQQPEPESPQRRNGRRHAGRAGDRQQAGPSGQPAGAQEP